MYEIKILSMFILMWAWLRDFVVSFSRGYLYFMNSVFCCIQCNKNSHHCHTTPQKFNPTKTKNEKSLHHFEFAN